MKEQPIENLIIRKLNAYTKQLVRKNTDIDMTTTYRVQNIADPIDGKDAANKAYLDDFIKQKLENESWAHVLRPTSFNLTDNKTDTTIYIKKIVEECYKTYGKVKVLQKTGENYNLCVMPRSYHGAKLEKTDKVIFG